MRDTVQDHIDYCIDLGLIIRGANGLEIANPIYRQVIPRELINITQINLEATVDRLWYPYRCINCRTTGREAPRVGGGKF